MTKVALTKQEAIDQAAILLTGDAEMIERHVKHAHTHESRHELMLMRAERIRAVVSALQGVGGLDGATFCLSSEQARMLMNYLDRVHVLDGPAIKASVDFDGDREGALTELLKAIVGECRSAYLRTIVEWAGTNEQ